jgi:hypothetical protein
MFGTLSSTGAPDLQAISDARFVISLCEMLTDREAVASEIKRFVEERGKAERAIVEVAKREQALSRREQEAKAHEEALAKREADVADREQQLRNREQRLAERRAEFDSLMADLKTAA